MTNRVKDTKWCALDARLTSEEMMPKPGRREIEDAYKRFKASSLKRCLRMGMSYNQANDLSQDIAGEAITRILEKVQRSDEIENITHYGLTIARNLLMDFFRKKGRADEFEQIMTGDVAFAATLDNKTVRTTETATKGGAPDHSIGNEKTTLQNLLEQECWKMLSGRYQEVFTLSIYKGMTAKLIAEQLGQGQNTVLTWMTKAKKQFIECYWGKEANA